MSMSALTSIQTRTQALGAAEKNQYPELVGFPLLGHIPFAVFAWALPSNFGGSKHPRDSTCAIQLALIVTFFLPS